MLFDKIINFFIKSNSLDNKMDAFGDGNYEFIDKYLVKCVFGDWEHILKFNEDYSKYTSIRKDNCIINGHLYDS